MNHRCPIAAAAFVLASAACTSDAPLRWLVVEERVEMCAAAPYSKPLDQVQGTQWRLAVEAGEYVLPDPQPLPDGPAIHSADASPMPPLLDVRDVDGASPFDTALEGAVLESANLAYQADDELDVLLMWSSLDSLLGESGAWGLSVAIAAETDEDFRIDGPLDVVLSCGPEPTETCPSRWFDACNPGGPTVRTRVTLDRGEVVLDVRYREVMPLDGHPSHVMFVATEVRVDDVALVQDDFFRLLHSTTAYAEEIGDGSYAVLAPETLGPAGLGCGIAIADVGTETPRAFTVDCALQELEPLVIVDIAREVLP